MANGRTTKAINRLADRSIMKRCEHWYSVNIGTRDFGDCCLSGYLLIVRCYLLGQPVVRTSLSISSRDGHWKTHYTMPYHFRDWIVAYVDAGATLTNYDRVQRTTGILSASFFRRRQAYVRLNERKHLMPARKLPWVRRSCRIGGLKISITWPVMYSDRCH